MARILFNDLPESVKYDFIRKFMGNADGNDSNIKELQNIYADIFSKGNYAIGGFSDDFIKKNNLKPYTRMLNPGQLNRLQKIKDTYATGEIDNDDDYIDRLTDFINDEAPTIYNEKNAEETNALRQFESEVFAGTPWEEDYRFDVNDVDVIPKEKLFRTLLNVVEDENGINSDGFKFAPTPSENAEWFKKFGLNAKKTGHTDQSGPEYELTGPKEALQRLWTEYDAMSNPDFDPAKDYGIADENNQWWADQIEEVDINDDGDTDVTIIDTNDNGKPDTAIITADSKAEEKEAVKAAKDELDIDKQTSTGKTKKELDNQTISDMRQKNVLRALLDHRF